MKLCGLILLDGEIVDRDPDEVGTNMGHLCQQPNVVADLRAALANKKLTSKGTQHAEISPTKKQQSKRTRPDSEAEPVDKKPAKGGRLAAEQPSSSTSGSTSATPSSSSANPTPQSPAPSGMPSANMGATPSSYSVNFGKAIGVNEDMSRVKYE